MGSCFSASSKVFSPSRFCGSNSEKSDKNDKHSESRRSEASSSSVHPTARTEDEILQSSKLKIFSLKELGKATENFRQRSLVGQGGFGCVFKGWINENSNTAAKPGTGLAVAVKRLDKESIQGHKEWLAEINCLGLLHHPNIVKLIGYCLENDDQLLVYEFMARGSLENHLFGRISCVESLSWNQRMNIALGTAQGLAFLHGDKGRVIHCDLKSANILLDSDYNPKLSDFGLAKAGPPNSQTHVSTICVGTYGYVDPEYMATGHLNSKSDVYSFGVILLELLYGQRAMDRKRPSGEQYLSSWAKRKLTCRKKMAKLIDGRIKGQYPLRGAVKAAKLALLCVSDNPKFRPDMNQAVAELDLIRHI